MSKEIDKSIAKAAANAKRQGRRRLVKIFGSAVASVFIAVLVVFAVISVVALANGDNKLTSTNAAFNVMLAAAQTGGGLVVILFGIALIVAVWVLAFYVNKILKKKRLEETALKKSQEALSRVNLRYDNINEITAVMDVLGMVTEKPKTKAEKADIAARLNAFIKAENIALPQTPETVAILDSLPAPDTPDTLAAALSQGATLRQAEDGQTLVLTTISGDKNILLTPVQTDDGVILCRQGVRIRSDLAPNLENIGISSMPASPEFFEGLPLEKDVVYPELPQPSRTFGPEMLNGIVSEPVEPTYIGAELPMPKPAGGAEPATLAISAPRSSAETETNDKLLESAKPHLEEPSAAKPREKAAAKPRAKASEQKSDYVARKPRTPKRADPAAPLADDADKPVVKTRRKASSVSASGEDAAKQKQKPQAEQKAPRTASSTARTKKQTAADAPRDKKDGD